MKSAAIYMSFLQQNCNLLLHKLVIFAHGILIFCRRISTFGRRIGQKNSTDFFFFRRIPECLYKITLSCVLPPHSRQTLTLTLTLILRTNQIYKPRLNHHLNYGVLLLWSGQNSRTFPGIFQICGTCTWSWYNMGKIVLYLSSQTHRYQYPL